MNAFTELELCPGIQGNLKHYGFVTPTPVQSESIPPALEGRDVVATAQTGTGKTLAFALPIVQRLAAEKNRDRGVLAIVLSPTRELAIQTEETFTKLVDGSALRTAVVVGGMAEARQLRQLRGGAQIMIATPGRLCDFLDRRLVDLSHVRTIVLDEADRMLDMGFLPALRAILQELPEVRQTLLFSATIEKSVAHLVNSYVKDPARIHIGSATQPIDSVDLDVYEVEQDDKPELLRALIEREQGAFLVFARTKHGTDKLAKRLAMAGVDATRIHGDRTQGQRNLALRGFKDGTYRVLVATDVAARGIHVDDIAHVVNYDLPQVPEDFIHRVGRTGRAGARGTASTFCTRSERGAIRRIERELSIRLERKTLGEAPAPARERHTVREIARPKLAVRPARSVHAAEAADERRAEPHMAAVTADHLEQAEVSRIEFRASAQVETPVREWTPVETPVIAEPRETVITAAVETAPASREAASALPEETPIHAGPVAASVEALEAVDIIEDTQAGVPAEREPRAAKPFIARAAPRPVRRDARPSTGHSAAPAGWGESPTWSNDRQISSERPSQDRPYRQSAAAPYRQDGNRAPRGGQGGWFRNGEQRPAAARDERPYRPAAAPYRGVSTPYENNGAKRGWNDAPPARGNASYGRDDSPRYGNDRAPRDGYESPRRYSNDSNAAYAAPRPRWGNRPAQSDREAAPRRSFDNGPARDNYAAPRRDSNDTARRFSNDGARRFQAPAARPYGQRDSGETRDNRAAAGERPTRAPRVASPQVAYGGTAAQARPGVEKKPFWQAVMDRKYASKFNRQRASGSR
jgi:ATP-dependent RNA helicase RhlE